MAWRNVVVTRHSKISVKMKLLVVQTDDDVFEVPLDDIAILLIVTTQSVITAFAMAELLSRDIKVVFSNAKGVPIGETVPYETSGGRRENVLRQVNWDTPRKDLLWQRIVMEKIAHQASLLEESGCKDADAVKALAEQVKPGDPDNREAVAAHMYFPRLYSYEFTRSDDDNDINGALNYGYAILLSETARRIAALGYLTEFGIHHDNDKNPFNLASDLMEPFRPYVDEYVLQMKGYDLDTEAKASLVKLIREDRPEIGTSIAQLIAVYVRDALHYLAGGDKLPSLGFLS